MPSDPLSYQPLIESYLKKVPSPLAAMSFANISLWQDFFQFEIVEIDGHLCVFASDAAGKFLYLPPLAKTIKLPVIEQCFKRMGQGVARIENVTEEQLPLFPKEKYKVHKKGYDYLYYRGDLADLKGDAFKSKRNSVNHFVKHHASEYEVFDNNMAKECGQLYDRWAEEKSASAKDDMHVMMIEDNRLVHRRIFKDHKELKLVGRVLKVDNKIVAYTFGHFLSKDMFCDLVEIADLEFKGAATYIFWLLCNDQVLKGIKFINVMDDMVPENVRRTKMSFRPAVMVPSYTVSPLVA